MSVKINPRDRITVTNFRYNPGSSISLFSLGNVQADATSLANGQVLAWDPAQQAFTSTVAPRLDLSGGTYDAVGPDDGSTIQIRYSDVTSAPSNGTLSLSELNYSFLPDSYDTAAGSWVGGDTLFIGDANGDPVAIGSKRIYDYANHEDGIVGPNNIVITDDQGAIDKLTIGQMDFSGTTIAVDNAGSNLYLKPGTLANIHAADSRIINLKDPVAPQDAVTKAYLDQAIANFSISPVTIADVPPANPDEGDLWYDSDSSYRTYVWHDATQSWIDLAPSVGGDGTGLVTISATPPASPEEGEAWYDSDDTGRTYIWDGSIWVDMNPTVGSSAPTTHVTIDVVPPATPAQGDLWYDAGSTYRLYVWDKFSSVWIDASPNITTDTTHAVVSDAAPTGQKTGDLWYDTDNFTTFVWDGFAWVDIRPTGATSSLGLVTIANDPPLVPEIGQAWYDADDTGRTYVWDGSIWVDMNPTSGGTSVSTNTVITLSSVPPSTPWIGQPYYDPITTTGYIWDGISWVIFSNPDNDVDHVKFAPLPPSATSKKGDLWFDQMNNTTLVYDGVNWLDIRPQDKQAAIDISTFPTPDPVVGSAWYDSDGTGRTYVWDGSVWVDIAPQAVVEPEKLGVAITPSVPLSPYKGQLWHNTFDKKTYTYNGTDWTLLANPTSGEPTVTVSLASPADPLLGDLWYETGNTTFNMWTGTEWLDLHEDIIAAAPAPVTISDTPPVDPLVGAAWYDSDNTGRTYVWDGAYWVDLNPSTQTEALIHIAADPPLSPQVGTPWYDADTTGRTYVWDGSAWIDIAPAAPANNWEKLETFSAVGVPFVSTNLDTKYKRFKVQLSNMSTYLTVGFGGVEVVGLTDTGRSVTLAQNTISIIEYPFSSAFEIENYFDGGLNEPSSYLLNKYNEKLLTITIKPKALSDSFQSGDVVIWGEA